MRARAKLTYDREYRGYVADVPSLPGCMSQGKTAKAALRNVRVAVALYKQTQPKKKAARQ